MLKIDGKTTDADIVMYNISNRVYVPLRAISELLDMKVEWDGKAETIYVSSYTEEALYRFLHNGLFGYMDIEGDVVCEAKYKFGMDFSNQMAAVQDENEKWGFINIAGELVIPCIYDDFYDFSEGLASVKKENGMWGYIDKSGKEAIPFNFGKAGPFRDGLACVYYSRFVNEFTEKFHYINKEGKDPFKKKFAIAYDFEYGIAWVQVQVNDDPVYIDTTGEVINQLSGYREVKSSAEGYYVIVDYKGNAFIVDSDYNYVMGDKPGEPWRYRIVWCVDGYAYACARSSDIEEYYVFNLNGDMLYEPDPESKPADCFKYLYGINDVEISPESEFYDFNGLIEVIKHDISGAMCEIEYIDHSGNIINIKGVD